MTLAFSRSISEVENLFQWNEKILWGWCWVSWRDSLQISSLLSAINPCSNPLLALPGVLYTSLLRCSRHLTPVSHSQESLDEITTLSFINWSWVFCMTTGVGVWWCKEQIIDECSTQGFSNAMFPSWRRIIKWHGLKNTFSRNPLLSIHDDLKSCMSYKPKCEYIHLSIHDPKCESIHPSWFGEMAWCRLQFLTSS